MLRNTIERRGQRFPAYAKRMEGIHLHTRALTYGFSYALHKLYSMNRSGMVGRGARFDWAAEVGLDELHPTANT